MSKFDPFDIYIPRTRPTTDGQIIRKRIRSDHVKPCYSYKQVEDAKKIVEKQYQIFPKGINLYENQLAFYDDTLTLDVGGMQWQVRQPIPVSFSSVYSDLKTDMSSFFQVVSGKTIESFYFECDLLSIRLMGEITSTFATFWQVRNILKDNETYFNLGRLYNSADTTNNYIDCSFINKALYSYVSTDNTGVVQNAIAQKNFNNNIDFLDSNVTDEPEFLNNLINENFTENDFNLVNLVAYAASTSNYPVSIANLFLTIRIKMYAIYK